MTVTLWVLCVWQLLRFKAGKIYKLFYNLNKWGKLFDPIWILWVLLPFLKCLIMTADKHYYIHVSCFWGGNIFLLATIFVCNKFKEVSQTLYAAVKQKRMTRNFWNVCSLERAYTAHDSFNITLRNILTFSHPFGRNLICFSKEINKPLTRLVNCILKRKYLLWMQMFASI